MRPVFDAYAAYYDLLYRDKDYASEAKFIQNLLSRHGIEAGQILDLGCGTGRHAEHFARMGYTVHGVDLSQRMVEAARKGAPLELSKQLSFELGDVRSLRLGRKFDAVISLFHVASYQITNDDLLAMFETAAIHLKDRGVFAFDFWYGPAVLSERPGARVKRMASDMFDVLRIAEPVMHIRDNVVDVNFTVLVKSRLSRCAEEIIETHRMRYLFGPELRLMLEATGFMVQAEQEWMSGSDLGDTTWLGTVVATVKS